MMGEGQGGHLNRGGSIAKDSMTSGQRRNRSRRKRRKAQLTNLSLES